MKGVIFVVLYLGILFIEFYGRQTMAKRIIQKEIHYCDDCRFGVWHDIEWNKTPEGLPITLLCPFYHDGQHGIVRGSIACKKFQFKTTSV